MSEAGSHTSHFTVETGLAGEGSPLVSSYSDIDA